MNTKLKVSTLADTFTRQHRELDERFCRLRETALSGDWRDCDRDWSPLSKALLDHMAFEERLVFPVYGRSGAAALADTLGLCKEHAEIRDLLERIGCEIELHHAPPAELETFITSLREHLAREDALLHPWITTSSMDGFALRGVRHWIRTRLVRAFHREERPMMR